MKRRFVASKALIAAWITLKTVYLEVITLDPLTLTLALIKQGANHPCEK